MSNTQSLNPAELVRLMQSSRVMVAGAGVAGRGVITMLRYMKTPSITVVDDNVTAAAQITAHGEAHAAEEYITVAEAQRILRGPDAPAVVITSPGWRPDSPLLVDANVAGIPVIGDIEAAWLVDQAEVFGSKRRWIAITGTNGKTTATAMLTAMFVADGLSALAVGNIGTPPGVALTRELRGEPRTSVLVAEVSSFQMHWAPTFSPDAGCVLNLAEDHLDWHGSFESYAEAKARVLRGDVAVIPAGEHAVLDTIFRLYPEGTGLPGETIRIFSTDETTEVKGVDATHAIHVKDGNLVETALSGETHNEDIVLASAEGISPPGPAGVADAAAAAALARSAGVSPEAIASALGSFQVQAHRGQVVAHTNGAVWIDNSKATNPHAALAALRGQDRVIWVAGGQLKGAQVDELVKGVAPSLKAAALLGTDRQILAESLKKYAPDLPLYLVDAEDPEEAMEQAVGHALEAATEGDSVILAPAAASLDMYTGMSQRGDLFAEYAMKGGD